MILLGWMGCRPEPVVDDWGDPDGTSLLVDDAEDEFADRVLPLRNPAARLVPGGPLLDPIENGPWSMPYVVVDRTPWPRVSVEEDGVRVLVYLERGALQARISELRDATGPDGQGRVRFRPGVPVDVVEEVDGRLHVTADLPFFSVDAWTTPAAVDEVWEADEPWTDVTGSSTDWPMRAILGGAEIVDRPGGTALATIGGTARTSGEPVRVTGEEVRGYLPVALLDDDVRVEGWAHADDLSDLDQLIGFCCCLDERWGGIHGEPELPWPRAVVPAGTWLRAGDVGPIVAVALRDLAVPADTLGEGAAIWRYTPFGRAELWADAADVQPDPGVTP